VSASACATVYATQVSVSTSVNICEHTLRRVYTCARVCAICPLVLGDECGGVQLVYRRQLLLAWRVILDKSIDRSVIYIFSTFDGVRSYVRGCVCIHTHTHTLHVVYSHESPGVRMRHLESPKNPNGLNLRIHISIYVHMYMYMLSGGMRSWTNCFFPLLKYSVFRKRKAKDVYVTPGEIKHTWI